MCQRCNDTSVCPRLRDTGGVADEDDDEALSWGADRDATHIESPFARPARAPRPSRADRREATTNTAATREDEPAGAAPIGSALLVILGILGGVYLLYTVGWIITVTRTVTTDAPSLELFALAVKKGLAIMASALWFAVALWLTRGRRPVVRVGWLVIGAIVLVPWPFVFGI